MIQTIDLKTGTVTDKFTTQDANSIILTGSEDFILTEGNSKVYHITLKNSLAV